LPDETALLLGKKLQTIFKTSNQTDHSNPGTAVKNTADDKDEEYIPLQTFAQHFVDGQTYALEMVFGANGNHAEQLFGHRSMRAFLNELTNFLTSNISQLMDYVVHQASMYSLKGDRLRVVDTLEQIINKSMFSRIISLGDYLELHESVFNDVKTLAESTPKYFQITEYDIGQGRMRPCLKILDNILPYSAKIDNCYKTITTLKKKYGSRARAASQSTADWKATMHAVRILDEGIELLTDHTITLPRPKADCERLLAIKRGEISIDVIKDVLSEKLESLKNLEEISALPKRTPELQKEFEEWLILWLRRFYA